MNFKVLPYRLFESIPKFNSDFWNWFKNSHVINVSGQPMIVYHGTNNKFDDFNHEFISLNTGNNGHYGYGFYFSDDIREAQGYGKNIFECYLSIQKPFIASKDELIELKKHGINTIDDIIEVSIDVESFRNEIDKIDNIATLLVDLIIKHGYERGWDIFTKNNKYTDTDLDLNDIANILVDHTTLNKDKQSIPDWVFEYLESIGIKKSSLKINMDFEYDQSFHWITDLGNYSHEITELIKKLGYDGIIIGSEYIAFYPHQIKSVDNIGTWNIDSNNINEKHSDMDNTDLYYKLSSIRDFLDTKFNGDSTRQCIRTTYFLNKIFGGKICGGWISSNPHPSQKGGFSDKTGKWNFHYWLVLNNQIIDITSDQFGEPKINILSISDKRYYNTANLYDIKQDFRYVGDVVDIWIDEYKRNNI